MNKIQQTDLQAGNYVGVPPMLCCDTEHVQTPEFWQPLQTRDDETDREITNHYIQLRSFSSTSPLFALPSPAKKLRTRRTAGTAARSKVPLRLRTLPRKRSGSWPSARARRQKKSSQPPGGWAKRKKKARRAAATESGHAVKHTNIRQEVQVYAFVSNADIQRRERKGLSLFPFPPNQEALSLLRFSQSPSSVIETSSKH